MKKEHTSLFSNLFGAKGKPAESEKSTPVVITSYSQPHVLQQRMKEEKLSHGETVTANISPVRLESNFGKILPNANNRDHSKGERRRRRQLAG
jgi:hypothetical protein